VSFAIALLLATQDPFASAAAYPSQDVLAAVKEACGELVDLPTAHAHITSHGWREAEPAKDDPISPLIDLAKSAGAAILKGSSFSLSGMRTYKKTVAGETLDLVLSGVQSEETSVVGCRIYDVNETRPLSSEILTAWAGRAASTVKSFPELTIHKWEPGILAGQDSAEVFFVPPGSPAVAVTKIAGLAFKLDYVGATH
jgi:hypothetical protein